MIPHFQLGRLALCLLELDPDLVRLLGAAPRPSRWERDALLLRHNLIWCRRQVTILNLRVFSAARKPFTLQRQGMGPQEGVAPSISALPKRCVSWLRYSGIGTEGGNCTHTALRPPTPRAGASAVPPRRHMAGASES
jgi:hypothetical protein